MASSFALKSTAGCTPSELVAYLTSGAMRRFDARARSCMRGFVRAVARTHVNIHVLPRVVLSTCRRSKSRGRLSKKSNYFILGNGKKLAHLKL